MTLAHFIPSDKIEERYAELFSETYGAPTISAREAVASIIIKEKLGLTDAETVEQIRENSHCQYLLGWEAFRDERPFDSSIMVHFRKRLSDSVLAEVNELIIEKANSSDDDDGSEGLAEGEANADSHQTGAECEAYYKGDLQTALLH